jgi:histidyl-tRNA synthetase
MLLNVKTDVLTQEDSVLYQAPRGTSDILPKDQKIWSYIKRRADRICKLYGYQRIDTPTFENSRLFVRTIGEDTDIVEKEMYSFEDKGRDHITLRPEGTASVCRAYIEHGMNSLAQPVKLFYIASIFRYERPQAGRYREHHQFGVEAIGDSDPAIDAEVIDMAWQFYVKLGLKKLTLSLNSIGCDNCRPKYVNALRDYYQTYIESLCADCKRRLITNPLRLLDCKNPACLTLSEQAPRSTDYLCQECANHFEQLKSYLELLNLPYTLAHRLVRGLDYYTRTVFEISPKGQTGAQVTLGGGGRYDNLIKQLGGDSTPAIGFATGIERLVLNLTEQEVTIPHAKTFTVFVAYFGKEAKNEALKFTGDLRKSGISSFNSFGERSLKAQLKQANGLGAHYTIIIGEDEFRSKTVSLRNMMTSEQEIIQSYKVIETLLGRRKMFNSKINATMSRQSYLNHDKI